MMIYINNDSPRSPPILILSWIILFIYSILYYMLYILIMCSLCIVVYICTHHRTVRSFSGGSPQYSLPFDSPLNADFFQKKPEHFAAIVKEIDIPLMNKCLVEKVSYVSPQTPDKNLQNLNLHHADFLLTLEYDIAPFLKFNKNVRFICGLYSTVVSILAPDRSNIGDFSDFSADTGNNITIAIKNIQSRRCLYDILSVYKKNTDHIKIIVQSEKDILSHYGSEYDIYFDVTTHPDPFFKQLTEKIPSHMVTMNKINSGNYFIKSSEVPFYKKYSYYDKHMIDRTALTKYYLQISPPADNIQYVPTLKSHLILLTHRNVHDDTVQHILRKVLFQLHSNLLFKGLVPADIGYNGLTIPYHPGTNKIYNRLQLRSGGLNYYDGINAH